MIIVKQNNRSSKYMGIFNKFKYMCKYKVQDKAKLNLLDIINIWIYS